MGVTSNINDTDIFLYGHFHRIRIYPNVMSEYESESLNTSDSVGRVLLILVCNISIIFSIQPTIETDKYNIIIRLLSECNYQKTDNFYQMKNL